MVNQPMLRYSRKKKIYYLNYEEPNGGGRRIVSFRSLEGPERNIVAPFALNQDVLSHARGEARRMGGYAWVCLTQKKKPGVKPLSASDLADKCDVCYNNKSAAVKYHSLELYFEAERELCRLQKRKFSADSTRKAFLEELSASLL